MSQWPRQSEMSAFYGNPTGTMGRASPAWMKANLVFIEAPYGMTYAGAPVRKIYVHKKCAASLSKILVRVGKEHTSAELTASGARIFGGVFNYRLMRGGNKLSIHSWGAAIDLDPARNAFHDQTPNFANWPKIVRAFEDEDWTWGGRWKGTSCDGMHFQAARV